jgi:catechol 2,3-dioxygenase-like lactoylglutathione lyase family enzyme
MIRTYGLTHVALGVRDVNRSAAFYKQVFGAVEVYRQDAFVQLQTPGTRDVLVLEEDHERAGRAGGIVHFGFRLIDPADIDRARAVVEAAGGTIRESTDGPRRATCSPRSTLRHIGQTPHR